MAPRNHQKHLGQGEQRFLIPLIVCTLRQKEMTYNEAAIKPDICFIDIASLIYHLVHKWKDGEELDAVLENQFDIS